ncbi:MAG TPA: 3-dehydro-L-gulonate 2-dehydrogenase [Rhodothermales bacterium]|nr:3-dehydro-L-gulonate 2-dehydrogenase [Rhodothermales bacterium]
MLRVPYEELADTLRRVLVQEGFTESRAALCARLFAETDLDGVYSHGLNRFPRFIQMVRQGIVDPDAEPERVAAFGAVERWDGHGGPGNLNAFRCMEQAVALAHAQGVGCVALRNTNHWMRGGTYGWQAAEAGAVGICWTNTMPNLPPWGAREASIGNNPLILAVPRSAGHVVLDVAMSQFSYGALASYRSRGEQLPVPGGFDREGRLTQDPEAIEASGRPLPIGYWKGSGLSMMLDVIAALLSAGNATHEIAPDPQRETGLSQVFIAFDLYRLLDRSEADRMTDEIVDSVCSALPVEDGLPVRYPGAGTLQKRAENLRLGIPVDPNVWEEVNAMSPRP